MKSDIKDREDIRLLIDTFYDKVKINDVIGPIFNDVAQLDWDHHMPIMYDFWSGLLLGERGYTGNPMEKHIALSKKTTMSEVEFSEWLKLFIQTTDDLFQGPRAEDAKHRASNIARLMLYKIQQFNQ